MSNIIDVIEKEGMRNDIPDFRVGDTVKVFVKVIEKTVEGNKEKEKDFKLMKVLLLPVKTAE